MSGNIQKDASAQALGLPAMADLPKEAWAACAELAKKINGASEPDLERVNAAIAMANNAHRGQKRKSGDAYIVHPMEVALLAANMGLEADAICAALLHDVAEDAGVGIGDIEEQFGKQVSSMVDALTKIEAIKTNQGLGRESAAKAETLRKMMLAMSRDVRVIIIKLCDRLHNLRTIESLDPARRRRIGMETQDIYAPIASRLGLDSLWEELQELSFKARNPWRHKIIASELEHGYAHRRNYIEAAVERVKQALAREGVEAEVSGRRKSAHSVYAKMLEKKLKFSEVHDREGLRVIVASKPQCYMAIGTLHELWKPMPGYFKDYIAIPKINGYQSLHTAILNDQGDPMEAQVRTREMHSRAEEGVAAHWAYKTKEGAPLGNEAWGWIQSLLDIQASSAHAEHYLEHVKTDLFSDEVYVFTPSGEVVALPRGASVLDFAFGIHSDVGLGALGAKVNGEASGLSRKLRSGDIVAIESGARTQAQPMWLAFAKTGQAKSHIRAYLRAQELPQAIEMGMVLLRRSLDQLGASDSLLEVEGAWSKAKKRFGAAKMDILSKIGRGALSGLAVGTVLAKDSTAAKAAGGLLPILIGGEESEIVHMARCCSPLPPQAIIGELSQSMGLLVHRKDCRGMLKQVAKGLEVDVAWEEAALTQSFSASIKIKVKNQRGALARLAAIVASMDGDVNNVRVSGNGVEDNKAVIFFDIQVRSQFHLDRVVEALNKDPAAIAVF